MSSSIWTQCAGSSRIRRLCAEPWRVVESQHRISTRKLVDDDAEQALLEELIDAHKPPRPDDTPKGLHYLLYTPFRYPPLRYGSRFGGRFERGIWYGSDELPTAFADVAYYRLLFVSGTTADLGTIISELTAFRIGVDSESGIDLLSEPFSRHADEISSPTRYDASHALGTAMREAGVAAFRYRSARDPSAGSNIGVFVSDAFTSKVPRGFQSWTCATAARRVEFKRQHFTRVGRHTFDREVFEIDGELPLPSI